MSHRHDLKLITPQIELFDFPCKHGLPLDPVSGKDTTDAEARLWEPSSANRQQTLKALPSEILHFPRFFHLRCILPSSNGTPSKAFVLQPKSTCLHVYVTPFLKIF